MSYDDYDKEFTDVSFDELKKFLKWMNEKKGIYPIIIGGWAVYAYKQALGSRDIDVVMPTDKDLNDILLTEYFPANGYYVKKDKHFNPKYYVKDIEDGKGRSEEVIVDVFIGKFSKEDEEGFGIKFHWGKVIEYQELKQIGGFSLYVPRRELLILLKVIASLERASKFDKTGDGKIPSKIWKDYHDIAILISLEDLDKHLLKQFLVETNVQQYIEKFLVKYKTDYPKILEDLSMRYEDIEKYFV